MVELPGEESIKDVVLQTQRHGGPIALLALMVVGAMLVGIGAVGYVLLPVMKDYVAASARTLEDNAASFKELSASMATVHRVHTSLMTVNEETQKAVLENGSKIDELQNIIKQMSEILQEARTLMHGFPSQRMQQHEEQLKKLQAIDDSVQQLVEEFDVLQR